MQNLKDAYVIGGVRTPFVKSMTSYKDVTTQDLMTATLIKLVDQFKLEGELLGDVGLGAVMNSSGDWNMARECVLGTKLHPYTPAYNLQRACGTGLENADMISNKIKLGQIEWGIAGGVDTNSDLPIMVSRSLAHKLLELNSTKTFGQKLKIITSLRPSDFKPKTPAVVEPRTGMSMGQHCEKMVQEWKISQKEQDELALISHQNSARAWASGFYNDLVFEYQGIKKDGTVRGDTTLEKLTKLKPVFERSEKGTLTAGNSSPLTDGSSAVLIASKEKAKEKGLIPLAKFVDGEVAALDFVHGDGLLMAPTLAVSRLLDRNGLKLQDFDFYEIHEAFAGQVLCTLKAWNDTAYCKKYLGKSSPLGIIDRSKMNINGGSVALGHPFAATGGRIVASLAKMIHQKGSGRGLISICTAGGMGVAAILEA